LVSALDTTTGLSAFKLCLQLQLAPLQLGSVLLEEVAAGAKHAARTLKLLTSAIRSASEAEAAAEEAAEEAAAAALAEDTGAAAAAAAAADHMVGRCRLTVSKPI
jgi:hypothetical protein